MEEIYVTKITKLKAKKNIAYPMVRFPYEMSYLIGKIAVIHQIDNTHFLVEIKENTQSQESFKTSLKTKSNIQIASKTRKTNPQQAPGGRFELPLPIQGTSSQGWRLSPLGYPGLRGHWYEI